ncbi:transposase [Francisellaceae bacterium]|nr:transposase [Francisellaceae bacterium]
MVIQLFLYSPIGFVQSYVNTLSDTLSDQGYKLSSKQKFFMGILLSVILLCNRICWSDVELTTMGKVTSKGVWWMYAKSNIPWDALFSSSVQMMLKMYGLSEGVLTIDDTENSRSKKTPLIAYTHKYYDKKSGGFKNGQELVFMVLVTSKITIPVGFAFYELDPTIEAWKKSNAKLIKEGVSKKDRPKRPAPSEDYRSKTQLAAKLVRDFKDRFPDFKIQAVLADALYGSNTFYDDISSEVPQLISHLKKDQNITYFDSSYTLEKFFGSVFKPIEITIKIRGGSDQKVMYRAVRVHVNAHGCKRFVIALKYEGQSEYRYLVASNLSWRGQDILNAYTLRWLVEVFFEDTKANGGWFNMAKQQGVDGSEKTLTLSLLLDHCMLCHPEQKALIENKLPAYTAGSLRVLVSMHSTIDFTNEIISQPNPGERLSEALDSLTKVVKLRISSKHMSGRNLGRLEETASLKRYSKVA